MGEVRDGRPLREGESGTRGDECGSRVSFTVRIAAAPYTNSIP